MEEARGSVRIGPISLFVLIITLCLAVLAVLSFTTARAQEAVTEQQAQTVQSTYSNERIAEEFLAELDAVLAKGRSNNADAATMRNNIASFVAGYNDRAAIEGDLVEAEVVYVPEFSLLHATFVQEGGRKLSIELHITEQATYSIEAWRASTEWIEPGSDNILWEG